jgi:hypothetical protein
MQPDFNISTLLSLLDDDDIWQQIADDLIAKGQIIEQELQEFCFSNKQVLNEVQTERLEYVLRKINFKRIYIEFRSWAKKGNAPLFDALQYLAAYIYPTLNKSENQIERRVEDICEEIEVRLRANMTTPQMMTQVTDVLLSVYGMSANDDIESHNFALNYLLAYKKAHSSLFVLFYVLVAQRAGLPVYPVCLGNYLLAGALHRSTGNYKPNLTNHENKELTRAYFGELDFFIDPADRGINLSKADLISFLNKNNISPDEKYLHPCTNVQAVYALLVRFSDALSGKNESYRVEEINQLIDLLAKYL